MFGRLWNLGVKVEDLEREVAFLKACGATGIKRWTRDVPDGSVEFAALELGGTRLVLLPEVVYETQLVS